MIEIPKLLVFFWKMKRFREKASANYQLQLRPNRDVENAFRAYETSWETERLESERNRQIYCELIDSGRLENLEKISDNSDAKITKPVADKSTIDDDSDDEEQTAVTVDDNSKWWTKIYVETNRPRTLKEIAVKRVAEDYKKGAIDKRIVCEDSFDFGLQADVELPILDLLELDVKSQSFTNFTTD